MWLLLIAVFGFVVPNGFFIHWLFFEYRGIGAVLDDHLAMGFMLDMAITTALLCVYFAKAPIGRFRWPWFLVLSLLGGLGFSLPLYWWLNKRQGVDAPIHGA